uniref:Signal recognition particle 19 kDa protein n=1 Tax=Panagrolaimus sp. ES5 TaxID=591445 RepID=A0AC34G568_9BILA
MNIQTKPYSDEARWITLYPAYLNSKKKKAEGRRIAVGKAVENPTVQEMSEIITHLKMQSKIEKKMYSRDPSREPAVQGRLRVQLKNDDGTFCNDEFKSKDALMIHIASLIPKLKSRQSGGAAAAPAQAAGGGKKKKK